MGTPILPSSLPMAAPCARGSQWGRVRVRALSEAAHGISCCDLEALTVYAPTIFLLILRSSPD